jgi:hypothetical protein
VAWGAWRHGGLADYVLLRAELQYFECLIEKLWVTLWLRKCTSDSTLKAILSLSFYDVSLFKIANYG